MRISMPRSSSPKPDGDPNQSVPLFERPGPSLRPELPIAAAPRAAAVKAGRRPPPKAARSGLDGREHAAPITSARKPVIALDQQQSIFETRPSAAPQDEVHCYWQSHSILILMRSAVGASRRTQDGNSKMVPSAIEISRQPND